ncbi:hypothetical protein KJZ24_16665 [Enterococcus faecalis]|uniref:Uncharacterized protein gp30 n=3 Tax=root TaxID=1 RepID=D2IZS2_9CAUD|nr:MULTISPECIES: hypothetical protein [Enterococcus]YP_003347592.1 hypothetical protein EP-phiFL3A_gp30 [Enterococcus phage phiFL3A]ACZ64116.1 conserved hypothetical protein [Enterococcus phage phiFL3B]ACZ64049.1 conserved hypothetical protein [Enterococcus phage phiFL3A]AXG87551.1 hypothetical protein DTO64_02825 [Enterococcus faecalis]MBD9863751.1 hypothetical protein [Enterococcus faecalis]MBD9896968.1 hypothetical protein [Enterococcus faecalis]
MSELTKLQKISALSKDLMNKKMNDTDRFVHLSHIHELAEELQPELSESQQIVLDWLKESCKLNGLREVIEIMGFLSTTGGKMKYKQVAYAYGDLNDDELKHVLQAFSRWAVEQEEG